MKEFKIAEIEEALSDIKNGKMVIVIDDEDRENEGDFVMAAEFVTSKAINFMAKVGRGLICTPVSGRIAKKFDLNLMVSENTSSHTTAFTVSIDHKDCATGISAYDRFLTIKELANPLAKAEDFLRPGHIFPLIAKDGGVLKRRGHTEATLDLLKLSGLSEVGIICEIMNEDGTMARVPDLLKLTQKYDLKLITIEDLKQYLDKKHTQLEEPNHESY